MKNTYFLIGLLSLMGAITAAEKAGSLSKATSVPLPRPASAGHRPDALQRAASVAVNSGGNVVGGIPLAPASSLASVGGNEAQDDVQPLDTQDSVMHHHADSQSTVDTQILSSGEESDNQDGVASNPQ